MFGKPYIKYELDVPYMAGPEYANQPFRESLSMGNTVYVPVLVDGKAISDISIMMAPGR